MRWSRNGWHIDKGNFTMDSAKIKNVVIAILLILNFCFLIIAVGDKLESRKMEQQMSDELSEVFSKNGITMPASVMPDNARLQQWSVMRDPDVENFIAEVLLGNAQREDQGGNIFVYKNENGNARFRGNGEFEIFLSDQNELRRQMSDSEIEKLFEKCGIEAEREVTDGENITYVCTADGIQIFNCKIVFERIDGVLTSVYGFCPMILENTEQEMEVIGAATALMKFLNAVKAGGFVCNSVYYVDCGYSLEFNILASVSGKLSSVWRIFTDSGVYYIDGRDGTFLTEI